MTDLILSEDFTSIYSLTEYLKEKVSASIIHGWPKADQALDMPCISIYMQGDCNIESHTAVLREQLAIENDSINVTARLMVGRVELSLVCDLWESSLSRLGKLFSDFKNAINLSLNQDNPKGLILELQGYYGTLARYDIINYSHVFGESEMQREEFRMKVKLNCSFDEIKELITPRIIDARIIDNINEKQVI